MFEYGDTCRDTWLDRTKKVRNKPAASIEATRDEIAFTTNTSIGMSVIAAD